MKKFLLFILFLLLCNKLTEAQIPTFADPPGPEHVLVVYNGQSDTSGFVKDYYVDARNIPAINVVELNGLTNEWFTYGGTTHWIEIVQSGDILKDTTQAWEDSPSVTNGGAGATFHAWEYFHERIATPIKLYLENTFVNGIPLKETIRYIVLCKGIPFKLQSRYDWSGNNLPPNKNVSLQSLLSIIGNSNYYNRLLSLFNGAFIYANPYDDVDWMTMDYRFLPNHFTNQHGLTLSYLVSRLDGLSYEQVTSMIYNAVNADMTGAKTWVLDAHPGEVSPSISARDLLECLECEVNYDGTTTPILDNSNFNYNEVIAYSSAGTHAGMNSNYITNDLLFEYAPGAVFNTFESFNGNSFGEVKRRDGQGLLTEFIFMEGTGGVCYPWEPAGGNDNLVHGNIFFPAYSVGYNLLDAIYMNMPNILFQNALVGDPLTTIYPDSYRRITITGDSTITTGEIWGRIIVPAGKTLTISSGATFTLRKNSYLLVYGNLQLNSGSTINFNGLTSFDLNGELIINGDQINMNFNDCSKFILNENITVNTSADVTLNFDDNSMLIVDGTLNVIENSLLNFSGNSSLTVNHQLNLFPGSVLNFNNESRLSVNYDGDFISQGESTNNIVLNFSDEIEVQFSINSSQNNLILDYTTINGGSLEINKVQQQPVAESILITNSSFNGCSKAISIYLRGSGPELQPLISNCTFNDITDVAIELVQIPEILIEHCTIALNSSENSTGIRVRNNGEVLISDVHISNGAIGITSYAGTSEDPEIIETLVTDIEINQCIIEANLGISFSGMDFPISAINISGNHFENILNGISINDFSNVTLNMSDNIMSGYSNGDSEVGISLMSGNLVPITYNSITNFQTGIYLSSVQSPLVINNYISANDLTSVEGPGIFAESCNGQIRKNTIQYHNIGIELGGSSPKVAENIITGNLHYGLYASSDSHPDLGLTWVGPLGYPLTGYNSIYENGICNLMSNPEIYLSKSTIDLESGCNTIADDREDDPQLHCDFLFLIDGVKVPSEINALENYWGNHPVYGNDPTGRFGSEISIDFSHPLSQPCTYSQGEEMLLLTTSSGEVYDTVYSSGEAPSELTDLQSRYASANEYYYNHQYTEAKQEYSGIIQNYGNERTSIKAYNKLLTIEKQINSSPGTFQGLKSFYLQKASSLTDSIMMSTLTHLSNLCLVAAGEYESAINNFDQIVQQNPNTDIALYREIDALTTALLVSSDSILGKQAAGKYYVSGMDDYNDKVRNLLCNRNGSGTESEKEQIPTEYTLYQNYPNPFNPTTTIKYDLPKSGNVELVIYDILGRNVKTLVNETKEAGRYEVKWDASSIASGVYIYQLITEKFVNTKKMILLR